MGRTLIYSLSMLSGEKREKKETKTNLAREDELGQQKDHRREALKDHPKGHTSLLLIVV
jgi:hypothetical protein